jgi:quinol monooxygenase YgiN
MKTIMVRYTTTEAHADANEALVHAVFNELRSTAATDLRYTTYRLAGGATFVHLATWETENHHSLTSLPSFQHFQAQLKARCVEAPVVIELSAIDSYGMVG